MSRRLMEMGVLPGTEVRVVRVAPLGDPLELRLRDYSLSVRRTEAAQITVKGKGIT
jgi:Fe2+ transport system protein FeoA